MKNTINDLAATGAVSWGSIAEKIDENFEELEDSISEGGGLDETKLKEYLEANEYAKKDDIPSNKKQISILFVGNSLTQDGIAYLPYMLKTYYPEVDFKIYMWYIGGYTLEQQYTKFTSGGVADIFSVAENSASWTNYSKNKTMASVLSTYTFDVVCMQEYFNYKSEYSDATDWNNCRDYIVSNYQGGNALEFVSLFHAPLRKDGYDVHEVYSMVEAGNALILQDTISQDMIPNGIAVYRALETDLNNLGDLGQLSPDGTHTQEGLPCLLQTYVTLCWLFERLGINKSVYGSSMRMTSAIYNTLSVPGANLGSGVVAGTDAQNLLAQEIAIKAYKEGKQFVINNLSPYGASSLVKSCVFSITTNVSDAIIKINGVEQTSVTVIAGSIVNWEVSKEGYHTQSGSDEVKSDLTKNIELKLLVNVSSISAEFTQGARTIFSDLDINELKQFLTVSVEYDDGTSGTTDDYVLSGELIGGTSVITVSYEDATTTFDVDVTAFELPDGAVRYGYIQKKTTSQSRVASSNFIHLNTYEDYNTLSMEAYIGQKANAAKDSAGILGARLASGSGVNYYALYWIANSGTVNVRMRNKTCAYSVPTSTLKAKIIVNNPSTSPLTVQINDGVVTSYDWTDSLVIPHPMVLFNNLPYGSTDTYYINRDAQIGDLVFRKENGECVGYYTPVVYEGRIGMYDQISKEFYSSSTASATTVSNSGCYYTVGNW